MTKVSNEEKSNNANVLLAVRNKNGVEWFNKLSPYHREQIRIKYSLKSRTLKITDEMLGEIYKKELAVN
jgi:hypothetical protein